MRVLPGGPLSCSAGAACSPPGGPSPAHGHPLDDPPWGALPNLPGMRRSPARPRSVLQTMRTVNGYSMVLDRPRTGVAPSAISGLGTAHEPSPSGTLLYDYAFDAAPCATAAMPRIDGALAARDASSFNDLSGRYSIRAQARDRLLRSQGSRRVSPLRPPRLAARDRNVLRFQAYSAEDIEESPVETRRIRRFDIYFYLEDESIEVYETRTANSGMPQGSFVRRHRIPRDAHTPGAGGQLGCVPGAAPLDCLTLEDLYVGARVRIYGTTFHVVDCDGSTRRYLLARRGAPPVAPLPYPDDDCGLARAGGAAGRGRAARSGTRVAPTASCAAARPRPCLAGSDTVLRFACLWDDRQRLYGDLQRFTLQYHLSDGTIEVLRVPSANDGRDRFPRLLRRSPVPKPAPDGAAEGDVYHWRDLVVGEWVLIYGRKLRVVDADASTRSFYAFQGVSQPPPALVAAAEENAAAERLAAPYRGRGFEEESPPSCGGVSGRPARPRPTLKKRKEKGGVVLRYAARILSDAREDRGREFVIMYFPEDNSIAVREPPIRNSGIVGGTFLRRMKAPRGAAPWTPAAFYIGAAVQIYAHEFRIVDADEYTLRYMEANAGRGFPRSDSDAVRARLAAHADALRRVAFECDDVREKVDASQVQAILRRVGLSLGDQELVTLMRALDKKRTGCTTVGKLLKAASKEAAAQPGK